MNSWSLIIFCYNEENSVVQVIQDAHQFLVQNANENSEIILVDDGSTDDTLKNAQTQTPTVPELKIVHIEKNQGIGNTLNTGYNLAQGDYICAIPGDGQFDINELALFEKIPEQSFISFYRQEKNYSIYRSILTKLNFWFNYLILGFYFKDVNWIKVYTKDQLNNINRTLNSSLVESEIVGKLLKKGIRPIYFPSKYLPRKNGKPKGGNFKTLKNALKETIILKRALKNQK